MGSRIRRRWEGWKEDAIDILGGVWSALSLRPIITLRTPVSAPLSRTLILDDAICRQGAFPEHGDEDQTVG